MDDEQLTATEALALAETMREHYTWDAYSQAMHDKLVRIAHQQAARGNRR